MEQNREEVIADFKQWLKEHKEQIQEHILDALPMEDFDDDWEEKTDGEINKSRNSRRFFCAYGVARRVQCNKL